MNLTLVTGRTIYLKELRQYDVYEGLLAGLPRRKMNDEDVQAALELASFGRFCAHLIEPAVKPLDGDDSATMLAEFGPAEALPQVACVSRWVSYQPTSGGPDYACSILGIVWFQDEYGLPQRGEILDALRRVPWDELAVDEEL